MKNYILLFFAALFVGCAPTGVQVTFDDENSNTIREHLQHYVDGDIDSMMSIIADDAEIYINSQESVSASDVRAIHELEHSIFTHFVTRLSAQAPRCLLWALQAGEAFLAC